MGAEDRTRMEERMVKYADGRFFPALTAAMDNFEKAAETAAKDGIKSEFRKFSHNGGAGGTSFILADAIHRPLRMLMKPIEESEIELKIEVDSTVEVIGVKNQIVQVVANLVHNAVQAMESVAGNGLGLSICYRIIEAHGGTIQVVSTPDTGTTFTVNLRKKWSNLEHS